jgi:hypothetical protein
MRYLETRLQEVCMSLTKETDTGYACVASSNMYGQIDFVEWWQVAGSASWIWTGLHKPYVLWLLNFTFCMSLQLLLVIHCIWRCKINNTEVLKKTTTTLNVYRSIQKENSYHITSYLIAYHTTCSSWNAFTVTFPEITGSSYFQKVVVNSLARN